MANEKISQMASATTPLSGTELVEVVQGGTNKKTTAQDIADLGGGGSVSSVTGPSVDDTDPSNPIVRLTDNRTVTGAAAILQSDNEKLIYFNSGSPFNFTIDQLTVDSQVSFVNIGAGTVTFVNGSGVTYSGISSLAQNQSAVILYRTANTPLILGGGSASASVAWGDITGTLSDQTDLQSALDAKQDTITFGTGVEAALGVNIGSAGAPVLFNGAGGTPSAITLTNGTGLPIAGITGLGSGVGTWLATPSWTNFLAAITGTAPYRALTGTNTYTGAIVDVGTTTNTYTRRFDSLGVTVTEGAGMVLENTTAAAAGAQQISPILTFRGQGWKSNATAASQINKWRVYLLPVQGTTVSQGRLRFDSSIDGGAFAQGVTFGDSGTEDVVTIGNDQSNKLFLGVGRGSGASSNEAFIGSGSTFGSTNANIQLSGTGIRFLRAASFTLNSTVNLATLQIGAISSGTTSNDSDAFRFTFAGDGAANMNPTSGGISLFKLWYQSGANAAFAPSSGSAYCRTIDMVGTINMTSTASGDVTGIYMRPTYTAALGNVTGIDYNPTVTSISGTHRAARFRVGHVGIDNGNLTLGTAGNKLLIKEGSNATMGVATLVGGTVTVNTTAVTSSSRIYLTSQVDGGTVGFVRVSSRSAATSFTITSSSALDTSDIAWVIVEPAP